MEFTGDRSRYTSLNLGENFWHNCYNKDNLLLPFVTFGTYNFIISLRQMHTLALTCKWFFGVVQWKLMECKQLRQKWGPVLAKKIVPYLVKRSHPFTYTGTCSKMIPIDGDIGIDAFGLRLLDTIQPVFTEAELAGVRYAFADIAFLTNHPVKFKMVLFAANYAILSAKVTEADFIDRGELSPAAAEVYRDKYGANEDLWPGRFYVSLRLPTRFNPITLGAPIIDMNKLHFCIAETHRTTATFGLLYTPTDIFFQVDFVLNFFTHAIVKFYTVNEAQYDWAKYGLTISGDVDQHVWQTSLVRYLDDSIVYEEPNAEVVMRGIETPYGYAILHSPALNYEQILEAFNPQLADRYPQ